MAGADLFKKITELTPANTDQEHLPIIMMSYPNRIKDRTEYLEGRIAENPGIEIAKICFELSRAGATVIGIPCNTAFAPLIFDKITSELKQMNCDVRLIHMIDETVAYIQQILPPKSKVGILSTNGPYRQKNYFHKLEDAGFSPIIPEENVQTEMVHSAVYHPEYGIKTQRGAITQRAKTHLYYVMDWMADQGAQAILMGATEIPLAVTGKEYMGIKLIDPANILARVLIAEYIKTNKLPGK